MVCARNGCGWLLIDGCTRRNQKTCGSGYSWLEVISSLSFAFWDSHTGLCGVWHFVDDDNESLTGW